MNIYIPSYVLRWSPFDCAHFAKIISRNTIIASELKRLKRKKKKEKILLDIIFLSAREAAAFPIYLERISLTHTNRLSSRNSGGKECVQSGRQQATSKMQDTDTHVTTHR